MANLNIFISSTYQDLKHFRYSLKTFFENFNYNVIEFENGDIPYLPNKSLFESCLKEIENTQIFILIIGKRYGTSIEKIENFDFCTEYKSITESEYDKAMKSNIPQIFTLVEDAVLTEVNIYNKLNKKKCNNLKNIFSTESVNTFKLINKVYDSDIPIQKFSIFSDVKNWLLNQFSGIFSDLLNQSKSESNSIEILEMAKEYLNARQKAELEYFVQIQHMQLQSNVVKIKQDYINDLSASLSKSRMDFFDSHIEKFKELKNIKNKEMQLRQKDMLHQNLTDFLKSIESILMKNMEILKEM